MNKREGMRIARQHDPMLRQIVGQLHVGVPDDEVQAFLLSKIKPASRSLPHIPFLLERAVKIHHDNRAMYAWVMGGMPSQRRHHAS